MSTISSLSAYVKLHERLIGLVLAAAVIWGVSGKIENIIAAHDKANQTTQAIIVNADAAKNAAVAQQYAADAAKMQEMQAASDAKQTALNNQIVAMATALIQQQKKDAVMTPTELTDRWNILVPTADASVTNGQVTLPEAGAVATVQQLEVVPEQAKKIDALNQKYDLESGLLVQSQKTDTDLQSQVTGLKTTLVDSAKKCEDDKKVIKDDARKRERWIGILGTIFGFVARSAIK
jgi:hypothetical protein